MLPFGLQMSEKQYFYSCFVSLQKGFNILILIK